MGTVIFKTGARFEIEREGDEVVISMIFDYDGVCTGMDDGELDTLIAALTEARRAIS